MTQGSNPGLPHCRQILYHLSHQERVVKLEQNQKKPVSKNYMPTYVFIKPLCCCSGAQLCLTLCDPVDCSTPGFPVLHCLQEFTVHVHWVGDAVNSLWIIWIDMATCLGTLFHLTVLNVIEIIEPSKPLGDQEGEWLALNSFQKFLSFLLSWIAFREVSS